MVATYKVVWEFVDANGNDWTEVYYTSGSNPSNATGLSVTLANARLSMLHELCTWQRIRVSDVLNTRSTATRVLQWQGTANVVGGQAVPGASIVCNLVGTTQGSRKVWLRGAPDYLIGRSVTNGRDVESSLLQKYLTAFFKGLQNDGYGLRQLTQTTKYPVVAVDGHTVPGQATLTFTNPGPGIPNSFSPPARLVLSQMDRKVFPGINGHWSILAANGLTITIRYQVAGNATLTGQFGFVKLEGYTGLNVFNSDSCSFDHFGTRTTKSPLSRSRGARRAVRIRSLA